MNGPKNQRGILWLAMLAMIAGAAPGAAAPMDEDTGWRLWLGEHYVGPAPAARDAARELPPLLDTRRELVIVTTAELVGESELLPRLIELRAAEGWDVTVATEADWDVPVGSGTDDRADRIRAYLADNYAHDPGAYALLIGDPAPDGGDVPMKNVHPLIDVIHWYDEWLADEMDPIPTDFYYADLTGEWDCDGDGQYGEYPDDAGAGCVDFQPELFVGRLPVYGGDAGELDTLLARAIARDLEQDKAYRGDVLLPGALFGVVGAPAPTGDEYSENDDGACILDAIYRDLPAEFQAGATRLFEDRGVVTSPYEHDGPLERDEVIEQWQGGRGLVVWAGHGGPTGAYRTCWVEDVNGNELADAEECDYPPIMESGDHLSLVDSPGAFTWHVSCDNGFPEMEANIGAMLLYGGAAATATASRVAFGVTVAFGEPWVPRPDLATSSTAGYYYALLLADGATAGEALAWTKYALPGDGWTEEEYGTDFTGAAWATRVEFNLYGDPTRSLERCETAADCDDGSPCNGEESCDAGFCIHSAAPPDCSALDDGCNVGMCDAASGECVATPRMDGLSCDDGLWCFEADRCDAGICGGVERDCGARDGYAVLCDESLQECVFELLEEEGNGEIGCTCTNQGVGAPPRVLLLAAGTGVLLLRRRRRRRSRGR
jgi:Peptidase family C25